MRGGFLHASRDAEIVEMAKDDYSCGYLSQMHKLSRRRIQQIIKDKDTYVMIKRVRHDWETGFYTRDSLADKYHLAWYEIDRILDK